MKAEKRAKKRSSKVDGGEGVKSLKEMNSDKSKKKKLQVFATKFKKKVAAFVDHAYETEKK